MFLPLYTTICDRYGHTLEPVVLSFCSNKRIMLLLHGRPVVENTNNTKTHQFYLKIFKKLDCKCRIYCSTRFQDSYILFIHV